MSITFTYPTVRVSPNALVQDLEGEAVLLDLTSEVYFGLDRVGNDMWCTLRDQGSVEQACQTLNARYDVAPEKLAADLDAFVVELVQLGLLLHEDR